MTAALDGLLGRMTMYRLTLTLLLVLTVEALVLSLTGLLAYTPAEITGTLVAAVGGTVIGTRVMALILRLRPHGDSSLITGLIVFLIMFPSSTAAGLGGILVAGAAAGASKFLLAFRGRHIFNPAATGAVVATLLGVGAAAWWVANAYMLPVVAVGAALLLYRTRKLSMGAVFLVVAIGILLFNLVQGGMTVSAGLQLVLTSYPVLFLLGFMMTEPLTLPPLRRQQWLFAVIVAVVLALQTSIGPVFLGPEFALVIGNAVAFLLGQRRGVRLSFAGSRHLTPTSTELVFEPTRPVRFKAGQYMELSLPHRGADSRGSRRVFSITSAPQRADAVTFGLRTTDSGSSFKKALLDLPKDAQITGTLVGGDFHLPRDPSIPLLLAAGGIGVTPFISQLRDIDARGEERDVVLVYVVRSEEEIAFRDELTGLGTRVVLFVPSGAGTPSLPGNWTYAGDEPSAEELLAAVPDLKQRRVLVSGSPRFIGDLRAVVRAAGVPRVKTDAFLGY
ncbi:ferredoxin-NADP reductase/Na+-transporting NADH:ubiquinone oxidoreductase subunit NqrB [Arthrobacter sp. PL16]|uniref:FAD-dependent oxidoreductase n=1 Tax=Arthrobacter sp. PL16 TaxID=3071720 RepID=UPI002E09C21C|nr:ferredoxin-NADP reductase/Na+-transporting NADH:ubiquinone oxidoreductase subunit NqrB [Arthrobacter sp. PL16]